MSRRAAASLRLCAMLLLTVTSLSVAPSRLWAAEPPRSCGGASLAPMQPSAVTPGASPLRPQPYPDGRFTPILLVHGFLGTPAMWSRPVQGPVHPQRSLLADLQALPGAAVYTLDYGSVADRWFAPDAGGDVFLGALDCLTSDGAFGGRKVVVVAHSTGGLIARWAVSPEARGGSRHGDISLAVTLGTPYRGSKLAAAAAATRANAPISPELQDAAEVLEGVDLLCHAQRVSSALCDTLRRWIDAAATVNELTPDAAAHARPRSWPSDVHVLALAARYRLSTGPTLFLDPATATVDLGDLVVDAASATDGGSIPSKIIECRYALPELRQAWDAKMSALGLPTSDAGPFVPAAALLVDSTGGDCFHFDEASNPDFVSQTVRAVAAQLALDRAFAAPRLLASLRTPSDQVLSVAYSPQGHLLAAGGLASVDLWDVTHPASPRSLDSLGDDSGVTSVAFRPDGRILAAGDVRGLIVLWDVSSPGRPHRRAGFTDDDAGVSSVAFSPDGHTLAAGAGDGMTKLWDVTDPARPRLLATFTPATEAVSGLAYSPDGHTLAVGGFDGRVKMWDVGQPARPKFQANPTAASHGGTSVTFSPDGHILAIGGVRAGGGYGPVTLWDVTEPAGPSLKTTLTRFNDGYAGAFGPDGQLFATAGGGTVHLWRISDPADPSLEATLTGPSSWDDRYAVNSVAFDPDGHTLAVASTYGIVELWGL